SPRATRWRVRAVAAVQTAALAALSPVVALRGRDAWADHTVRLAGVLGKLSFGGMYPVYREADAAR
ncbi:glycosyltransferase family 2 protein, partial [Methylopila musalis]